MPELSEVLDLRVGFSRHIMVAYERCTLILGAAKTSRIRRVGGMHCKMCAQSITKALWATSGVEHVNASFEKGDAVVQFDDQKVTGAGLREIINKTGFKAVEGAKE